jgi:hypothetical protein
LPGTGGSHLWLYLLRRQRSGRSQFEASPGKQFMRLYLKKNLKNRGGGMGQGVSPEFKAQYWKKKLHKFIILPFWRLYVQNKIH